MSEDDEKHDALLLHTIPIHKESHSSILSRENDQPLSTKGFGNLASNTQILYYIFSLEKADCCVQKCWC